MRIKFDKEYLKYYTYAALGVITMILFYKISDNLGFVRSGAIDMIETGFELLLLVLLEAVRSYFLFRPMRWMEKQGLKNSKGSESNPKSVKELTILAAYGM